MIFFFLGGGVLKGLVRPLSPAEAPRPEPAHHQGQLPQPSLNLVINYYFRRVSLIRVA